MGVFAAVPAAGQDANDPAALWAGVTIYRDEWGTPHIYAPDARAMAFGFGYAQAEDHLERMLLAYRVAKGRASEIMGESYAESDEFAIIMGHADVARNTWPLVDSLTRDLCEGFAIGVNTWMMDHRQEVPNWEEGVRPEDILALMHCYLMSFAPFDLPDATHRLPAASTGNAWAISPTRTATGETMLVVNPHTYYDGPFQWYEAHLVTPELNITGATLFGLPVILMGHNDALGWGLTPNQADTADIYASPINETEAAELSPLFSKELLLALQMLAESKPYYVRQATGMQRRLVERLFTEHGPVVARRDGHVYAYQVAGYGDAGWLTQLYEMGMAQNLNQFQAALAAHQLPCFHVVYGDREGNIFYSYNAKLGSKAAFIEQQRREPRPIDWSAPVPATSPVHTWTGIVPLQQLPALLNPPAGYVQACGNPPWTVTDEAGLDSGLWPQYMSQDYDSARAARVRQLLSLGAGTFEESQAMLYDVFVPLAAQAVPSLLRIADSQKEAVSQAHPDLPQGLDILRRWNFVAETNSPGMTVFRAWWSALELANSDIANPNLLLSLISQEDPLVQEMVLRTAVEGVMDLRNRLNAVDVPWGDVHVLSRGDEHVPVAGALTGEPICVTGDQTWADGGWPAGYGYGFAMVVAFGEFPESVSVLPFGTSEDPESRHYADQMDLFVNRQFKYTRFQHEDVQRHATRALGRAIALRNADMESQFTFRSPVVVEARIATSSEPPAPLPEGKDAYTPYARTSARPANAPVQLKMELYIQPEVCPPKSLRKLELYVYDEQAGWQPLDKQDVDAANSLIRGQDAAPRTYVVLGPPRAEISPVVPGAPEESQAPEPLPPAESPRDITPRAEAPVVDSVETGPAVVEAPAAPQQPVVRPVDTIFPAGLLRSREGKQDGQERLRPEDTIVLRERPDAQVKPAPSPPVQGVETQQPAHAPESGRLRPEDTIRLREPAPDSSATSVPAAPMPAPVPGPESPQAAAPAAEQAVPAVAAGEPEAVPAQAPAEPAPATPAPVAAEPAENALRALFESFAQRQGVGQPAPETTQEPPLEPAQAADETEPAPITGATAVQAPENEVPEVPAVAELAAVSPPAVNAPEAASPETSAEVPAEAMTEPQDTPPTSNIVVVKRSETEAATVDTSAEAQAPASAASQPKAVEPPAPSAIPAEPAAEADIAEPPRPVVATAAVEAAADVDAPAASTPHEDAVGPPPRMAMGWGQRVLLTPPESAASVEIDSETGIGVRAVAAAAPPAPLPAGLAAFSDFISTSASDASAKATLSVGIGVSPSVCQPKNLFKLAVYGYAPDTGWQKLEGQQFDPDATRFTATDSRFRTYAVAGPAEARLGKP